MKNKKGDIEWDTMIYWIIGILVLVLSFFLYKILSGKGTSALEYLKNLFRFGR